MVVQATIHKANRTVTYGGKSYKLPKEPFVSQFLDKMRTDEQKIQGEICGSMFYPHINGDSIT